ncbi:MAG: tripartite tricarboxylate transporter substrate binding protein [Ruegeria sp.]|uniref:tripartite tricarboxylate transporter substrate binding protein n=1 Tax=Ruegeria sp. TaxID=1879320 RepID=UPI00349EA5F7
MKRRAFLGAVTAAAALVATATAGHAAGWPKRPINLVVPYKAGGGTDAYARAISAAAEGVLDVPVVVVNKPGSGGLNGANAVVGARPDGYTMMMTSGGSFLLSTMTRDTKIDALDSFDFVAQVGQLRTSLMVPTGSPYQTVQDVIDAAKADPGSLRWAHSGRGGFHHVGGLGFLANNGIEAQDVPFKGGGPTRAALIGEQADFGFLGVQQLRGFEEQLRALAVNSADRDTIMSDVPSFGELGVPFAAVSSPVIVFAPKGTPAEVISTMETALAEIAAKPEFAELLAERGTGPVYASGADAKAALAAMKADAAPLVETLNN